MSFTDHVFSLYVQLDEDVDYQSYDGLVKSFVSISGESEDRCKLYVNHAMLEGFFGDLSSPQSTFKAGSSSTLKTSNSLFSNINQDYFP